MFWFVGCSWQELLIGLAVRLLIIIFILPIHEYAHAWMAHRLGDNTAKHMGRLTLNPAAHIDWLGAGFIMLFGFGWAKPVPVNPFRFNNQQKRRSGMALTAFAGPASNLIVAFAAMLILRIIACFNVPATPAGFIYYAFYWLYSINISLAVFNLLPVYPFDGSRILGRFLPESWNNFLERNARVVTIATMLLVFGGLLDPVINFLVGGVSSGMLFLIDGLFDILGLEAAGILSTVF